MKIYTTSGIVFRTLKYGDTSLILDAYTIDKGLRSFIVGGIRSKKGKSGTSALYQLMNQLEIVAYDNDSDKLSRIKEVKLNHHYMLLQSDVIRSAVGVFLIEVCRNTIREKESNPELYHFLISSFDRLDQHHTKMKFFPHQFMLQLSKFLGFFPLDNQSAQHIYFDLSDGVFTTQAFRPGHRILSASDSRLIALMLKSDLSDFKELNLDTVESARLLDALILYYQEHIPDFRSLKSLDVLRTILH